MIVAGADAGLSRKRSQKRGTRVKFGRSAAKIRAVEVRGFVEAARVRFGSVGPDHQAAERFAGLVAVGEVVQSADRGCVTFLSRAP